MAKEVIHTIKLKGQEGYDLRLLLAEHYDVVASSHHSPDGETIFYDLELFPKGSLPFGGLRDISARSLCMQ